MLILAQQITLNPQEIVARLAPRTGVALIYDILLYLIFILSVLVMFMQSDKQLVPTVLSGLVAAIERRCPSGSDGSRRSDIG